MIFFCVSILLAWLSNAYSVHVEQTPRSATKEAGETLTINCALRGSSYGLYGTAWFRQTSGRSGWDRLSIGGRYVETVNNQQETFSLQIRNLVVEDTATYFCKATALACCNTLSLITIFVLGLRGSESLCYYYDGAGTKLTVKPGKQPTPPIINLLYSASDEQKAKGLVELICLIGEYQPQDIRVNWLKNGQAASGFTTVPPAETADGTFTSTSVFKVQLNDWASGSRYSCQVSHSATGSTVQKDIQTTSDLAILLSDPTVEEIWINKTATLVCEVISTAPTEVAISWTVDGKERVAGIQTDEATKAGNQYLTIGRLTSNLAEWDSGVDYSCSARDHHSATPVSQRTRKAKAKPVQPTIRLLPPSPEEIQSANTATLTCLITEFYPNDMTVSWEKDGAAFRSNATNIPSALEQDKTFSAKSLLFLTPADWKKGATYSCVATHLPSQSILKRSIRITKEDCNVVDINAVIQTPSFEEIWTLQKATIVCEVVYTDLQNVKVSWRVNGSLRMEGVQTRDPEWRGSKSVIVSKLKVSVEEWESGVEYLCFVEDNDLPTPVKVSTTRSKVTEMERPKVYLLHPSSEEIQAEKVATIVCLATGFYPSDIYVAWMANDTLLDSGYTIQLETDKENGSSSVASKLKVTADDWEKGTTFTCLVGHPSLATNLVRSINKTHGKPTLVNVSLVLTDSFKSCI